MLAKFRCGIVLVASMRLRFKKKWDTGNPVVYVTGRKLNSQEVIIDSWEYNDQNARSTLHRAATFVEEYQRLL